MQLSRACACASCVQLFHECERNIAVIGGSKGGTADRQVYTRACTRAYTHTHARTTRAQALRIRTAHAHPRMRTRACAPAHAHPRMRTRACAPAHAHARTPARAHRRRRCARTSSGASRRRSVPRGPHPTVGHTLPWATSYRGPHPAMGHPALAHSTALPSTAPYRPERAPVAAVPAGAARPGDSPSSTAECSHGVVRPTWQRRGGPRGSGVWPTWQLSELSSQFRQEQKAYAQRLQAAAPLRPYSNMIAANARKMRPLSVRSAPVRSLRMRAPCFPLAEFAPLLPWSAGPGSPAKQTPACSDYAHPAYSRATGARRCARCA